MRGLASRTQPSALSRMLGPAGDQRADSASAFLPVLQEYPRAKRGLLTGILDSLGNFLGFGNNQAQPADPKDTGSANPSTTIGVPSNQEPTGVKPPKSQPSPPAQAPSASYPAPGGGGQGDEPPTSAPAPPAAVSSSTTLVPASSSSRPAAMNVVPPPSTAPPAQESQNAPTDYVGTATSHTVPPGWPSISGTGSSAWSSPGTTQSPPAGAQGGHAKGFPLAAAAAIGAVLGFVVVSAIFWAIWLWLRKRRRAARAFPEFASVHPEGMLSVESASTVPLSASASGEENPFKHPRDEKEDNPFDAALLWRASTVRSASTMSI